MVWSGTSFEHSEKSILYLTVRDHAVSGFFDGPGWCLLRDNNSYLHLNIILILASV